MIGDGVRSLFWLTNSIGRFQLRIEGILSERDIVRVLGERPLLITITAPIFRPARRFGSDGLWNSRIVRTVIVVSLKPRVLDEPVSAVMTREVVSCRQTDTVVAIMEMMTLGKLRHLPVVEEGMVVGLISIGDIVKWRVREYEIEQEALRDYIKTA